MGVQVTVTYICGGCDATVTPPAQTIRREFVSLSGSRDYGIGSYHVRPSINGVVTSSAPEGWVPFDPYTQATYCGECWAGIEAATGDVRRVDQ